jgi:GMP synthase (glutamine-hydrolysing)
VSDKFDVETFIEEQRKEIVQAVGSAKVLCAVSGGVDSTALAAMSAKVLGDRLFVVFIDDGLMREGEGEFVKEVLAPYTSQVEILQVADEFFEALKGKVDPEEKRKAFRHTFYSVLGRAVRDIGATVLLQGTIKADIDETAKGIKTQHNVLEQIGIDPSEQYGYKIVEPLRTLYKPAVRQVAKAVGLPESVFARMPFPGPGLATRVLGEVTPDRVATVRKAHVFIEEALKPYNPFQAFAVLLTDKATGMRDGKREFGEILVVRSVQSTDALTATPTQVPWDTLVSLQETLTKEVPGVVKVLLDITPKPPSTIEYI